MAEAIELFDLSIKTSNLSMETSITTEMTGTRSHNQQNMWLFVCESVSLIIILVVSLVANAVAIATILRIRSLKSTPHHLLVLNLSVADLGITLTSMTFALHSVFDGGFLLQSNPVLCKINGFFAAMFTLVNFPTVLSIAIDRFLIVVYSRRFPPNRRRIIIMICTSWTIAFLIALMPALDILSEYSYSPNTCHCSPRWDHSLFRTVCAISIFGLAIPMVAGCYAAIVYFIWTKQRLLRSHGSKRELSAYRDLKRLSRNMNSGITSGVNSPMASTQQQLPASPTRQLTKASSNLSKTTAPLQACQGHQKDTIRTDASDWVEKGTPAENLANNHGDENEMSATGGCGTKMQLPSVAESASLEEPSYTNEQKQKSEKTKEVRQYQLSTDKRVAIMGALLVLTTLICWMPYLLVHSNYVRVSEGHWFAVFTMLLGYLNAVLDPVIYTFMNKRARTECKRYLCCNTSRSSCPCLNPMTTTKR